MAAVTLLEMMFFFSVQSEKERAKLMLNRPRHFSIRCGFDEQIVRDNVLYILYASYLTRM